MQHVAENLMTALNYINILTTWVIADLKLRTFTGVGVLFQWVLQGEREGKWTNMFALY